MHQSLLSHFLTVHKLVLKKTYRISNYVSTTGWKVLNYPTVWLHMEEHCYNWTNPRFSSAVTLIFQLFIVLQGSSQSQARIEKHPMKTQLCWKLNLLFELSVWIWINVNNRIECYQITQYTMHILYVLYFKLSLYYSIQEV